MHYLSTSWDSVTSETVSSCFRKCGFQRQLASEDTERSEDDPVACASDIDDDINEEFLSTGADAPFAEFVSIDDNVPTCEPQSVAEIVAEVVEDEAPKDGGENESVRRPANFAEALAVLEALQSFFCTKNNENADKGLQCVQKELFLSKDKTLKIDLWMAVQMIKGRWTDVTRETMRNCFKKAGFVRPSVSPASVEDVVISDAREDARQAWNEATEARLVCYADDLNEFVAADDAVWVTEELDDSAIVREVRADACPEATSSDEDSDDDISLPVPIGSATANEYMTALKDLVFSRGLREEHVSNLENLEKAIRSSTTGHKQAAITEFFEVRQ
ncbi:hypothetical protein MTO96_028056 [Rhipicephalus appendiculatus]